MKTKTIAIATCLILLTCALASLFSKTEAQGQRVATLSNVKGTVQIRIKGESDWKSASDRMPVAEGDEIKTAGGSSVIIKMDDGALVKVGPLARMKVAGLAQSGSANATTLDMKVGKTWSKVNKLSGGSSFSVKTPTAVAGVRGTFFSSEVQESNDASFDVFDGMIEVAGVKDPNSKVSVGENMRTTVAPGKDPTQPSAIPASELEAQKNGFSSREQLAASFDVQIAITPQSLKPGETATLSLQVYKDGKPYMGQATAKLTLSGSATFASSGSNSLEVTTDDSGAASLSITSSKNETVNVSVEMRIKAN